MVSDQMEWDSPMYSEAVAQFEHVAEVMNLDDNVRERLTKPQRALVVTFPFRRDEYADVGTAFGYRVQHLLTMGPTKRRRQVRGGRQPGRGHSVGDAHDVEMRHRGLAVRRRQGRCPHQPP